jgi:hypothetical protein
MASIGAMEGMVVAERTIVVERRIHTSGLTPTATQVIIASICTFMMPIFFNLSFSLVYIRFGADEKCYIFKYQT